MWSKQEQLNASKGGLTDMLGTYSLVQWGSSGCYLCFGVSVQGGGMDDRVLVFFFMGS